MCAIHGIVDVKPELMMKMVKAAHHRGPDGNGIFEDDYITLGHNLLSIVGEVKDGKQPYHYEDCILVYNGEIYNYKDLSHNPKTDTETLAIGLKNEGWEFLKKCDGMFALAFYNKTTKELILARDKNGAKPLYWGHIGNKLAFSSEIKSLLKLGFERKVDHEAFGHYYKQGYNSGYLTMFKGIKKLIPGQILEIDIRTDSKNSFNINSLPIPEEDMWDNKEDLKIPKDLWYGITERFSQAVKSTLMGRKKIGLFLSGGVDSQTIFYEMLFHDVKPRTFSTSFNVRMRRSRLNEDSVHAEKLAQSHKVKHTNLNVSEDDFITNFEDTIYALEEPRQSKSLPTYFVTNKKIADKGITVTLSGDGGDELLAGYKHHKWADWDLKLKQLCTHHRQLKSDLWITHRQQKDYLASWLPNRYEDKFDKLNDFMYIECLNTLSEDFLIRNDKLGMAHSLEGRFPFLCNSFRNYVRSIPGTYKTTEAFIKGNWSLHNKQLFKDAYKRKITNKHYAEVCRRGKTGWRFPTDELVVGRYSDPAPNCDFRTWIYDTLNNNELMEIFEYKKSEILEKYMCNFGWTRGPDKSGNENVIQPNVGQKSQKELFTILGFAGWYKVFKMSM